MTSILITDFFSALEREDCKEEPTAFVCSLAGPSDKGGEADWLGSVRKSST